MKRFLSALLVICMLSTVCVFAADENYVQALPYSEGYASIKDKTTGLFGLIDEDGNVVIECKYSTGLLVREGLIKVKNEEGKIGFINTEDEVVVPFLYDDAYGFMNGLTKAERDGVWGYVDTTGAEVIPFEYEHAISFYSDIAAVKKDGKFGFINKDNEVVIDFQYDKVVSFFQEGAETAVVELNGEYITISKGGDKGDTLEADSAEKAIVELDKKNNPEKYEERENRISFPVLASAKPTDSTILINGEETAFDAYNIIDYNFFKLRDLAYVLNGTQKQFEVEWDEANNAISLTTNKEYTPVGDELQFNKLEIPLLGVSYRVNRDAVRNNSKIYLDGEEINLVGYTINDYNYFRLRDVAALLDVGVTWDEASETIGVDTSIPYTE